MLRTSTRTAMVLAALAIALAAPASVPALAQARKDDRSQRKDDKDKKPAEGLTAAQRLEASPLAKIADEAMKGTAAGTYLVVPPKDPSKADGTDLKKLASRNGYRGVIDYLDVHDFHDGSSDLPVWAPDSRSVFYTSKVGRNVELFRVTLDGKSEQLTETPAGSMHYHPAPSRDGKWLLYGSKRDGVRQLYVMRLSDKMERRITDLTKGRAAMWPGWQPTTNKS